MNFFIKSTDCKWFDSLNKEYFEKLKKYKLKLIENKSSSKEYTIELNILEELLQLQKELDIELIINGNTIEIYDEWRES